MIKVGNVLKVVKGNRFVGDYVEVTKVDEQKGIFVVLNKDYSLISDIYTLADILDTMFIKMKKVM